MDERMRLVHLDAADLAKTALMEVASVRSGLTQVRNGPSNDIYVLCIYDGSTARTSDAVEASLSSAAAVTHSDCTNAFFVLLPTQHGGLASESVLKHGRLLEDRLMAHHLEIGGEVFIGYTVLEEHGNDRRRTSQRARLVVSKTWGATSAWNRSQAARGSIGPLPVLRVRDMLPLTMVPGDADKRLSPADRLRQRGLAGSIELLEQLHAGLDTKKGDKLLVVDFTANYTAELAIATYKLTQRFEHKVLVTYLGIYQDKLELQSAQSKIKGFWMTEWWNVSPEAGPALRTHSAEILLTAPPLKLGTWCTKTGQPKLLADAMGKFDDGDHQDAWRMEIAAFLEKFPVPSEPAEGLAPVNAKPSRGVSTPDYDCGLARPRDTEQAVAATAVVPLGEFAGTLYPGKIGRTLGMSMTDEVIYVIASEDESARVTGPVELLGFNTGNWSSETLMVARQFEHGIPFLMKSDTTIVCLVDKGTKTLMPLASVAQVAFSQHGIPAVLLEGHSFLPCPATGVGPNGGQPPHFRFQIAPKNEVHIFVPDALADGLEPSAIKPGQLGARLSQSLRRRLYDAGGPLEVIWEVELECNPPAMIRPIKPKLWLMGKLSIAAAMAYRF